MADGYQRAGAAHAGLVKGCKHANEVMNGVPIEAVTRAVRSHWPARLQVRRCGPSLGVLSVNDD